MIPFFIHIPKNGGMTIRRSPLIKVQAAEAWTHKSKQYTQSLLAKMHETNDHPGIEHARYQDLNPFLFKGSYQPFAIIRNPWDRVVSRYFFAKKVIEVEKKVPKSYADVSTFEAFLKERSIWGSTPFMWHRAVRGWYPAWDHLCDHDGKLGQIDILRFENYSEDFKKYFKVVQEPAPRNVTALNKGSYRDVYTPKTIQMVADWYSKDIETWGYDFDSGPTRNTWALK